MPIKDSFKKITNQFAGLTPFIVTTSLSYYKKPFEVDLSATIDHIRLRSLELVSQEIKSKGVPGEVAEVGVYKGDFAKYINSAFPSKKIYLFDTFEGFHEKDVEIEIEQNFSAGDQDFSNTSTQLVLGKMKYKENVIFKKGYFPESAEGVEETFCFVSLDTDLYKPIYDGLNWFSKRMNKGGYIFVHDFNNDNYTGARKAVVQFSSESGRAFFPLCDSCGTAVIPF